MTLVSKSHELALNEISKRIHLPSLDYIWQERDGNYHQGNLDNRTKRLDYIHLMLTYPGLCILSK